MEYTSLVCLLILTPMILYTHLNASGYIMGMMIYGFTLFRAYDPELIHIHPLNYGLETYTYYSHYPLDHRIIKATVSITYGVCTYCI